MLVLTARRASSNHVPCRVCKDSIAAQSAFGHRRETPLVRICDTHTRPYPRITIGDARPRFGKEWYAGCTTAIIGNSVKAGVRFLAFDAYKNLLADEAGHVSGPKTVLAGFGAGVTESLLAVTPFESIKTQM